MTDVAGRDYVDYHLGSGPALLGHAHPEIVDAVAAQLHKGPRTTSSTSRRSAGERMVDAIPCAEHLQFAGSGSEATLYALRLARAATGREKILKFEGGWHGMNEYALWGTTPTVTEPLPVAEPDSAGIPSVLQDEVLVAPFNDRLVRRRRSSVSTRRAGGGHRRAAPTGLAPGARIPGGPPHELTTEHGIVLIFDEVVTGFRIAWGGAQERYGVVPDLATYGKAMSAASPWLPSPATRDLMGSLMPAAQIALIACGRRNAQREPHLRSAGVASLDVLSRPGVFDHLHRSGLACGPASRNGPLTRLRGAGTRGGRGVRCPIPEERRTQELGGPARIGQGARFALGHRAHQARRAGESE